MTHTNLHYNSTKQLPCMDEQYILFINGNEQVLAWVYDLFYERLLRYRRKITDNDFVINTAIQDAFMKCWKMREQMEHMRHIYYFLRLNIRWSCYAHYRKEHARGDYVSFEANDEQVWMADPDSLETNIAANESAKEKVRLIDAVIPCLPMNRQTVLKLYFRYGFSYQYIAKRLSITHAAAYKEVESSLLVLKKIIHSQERLSRHAFAAAPMQLPEIDKKHYRHLLVHRWHSVFHLSFKEIGERLKLQEDEVKRIYVEQAKGR